MNLVSYFPTNDHESRKDFMYDKIYGIELADDQSEHKAIGKEEKNFTTNAKERGKETAVAQVENYHWEEIQ